MFYNMVVIASVLRGVPEKAATGVLGPDIVLVRYGHVEIQTVHLAHPGIIMRRGSADHPNPWPERHAKEHIPGLRDELRGLDKD